MIQDNENHLNTVNYLTCVKYTVYSNGISVSVCKSLPMHVLLSIIHYTLGIPIG